MRAFLSLLLGSVAVLVLCFLLSPPSSAVTPAPSPTPPPTLTPLPSPTPAPSPTPPAAAVARLTVTHSLLRSLAPCLPAEGCCVPQARFSAPLSGTVLTLRQGECVTIPVSHFFSMWSTCPSPLKDFRSRVIVRAAQLTSTVSITSWLRGSLSHGPAQCWGTFPSTLGKGRALLRCFDQEVDIKLADAGCGVGDSRVISVTVRCSPNRISHFEYDTSADIEAGRLPLATGSGAFITSAGALTLYVCAGPLLLPADCICVGPGVCSWNHVSRTYAVSGTFPATASIPLSISSGLVSSVAVSDYGRLEVVFRTFVTPSLIGFGPGLWYYSHTCVLPTQYVTSFVAPSTTTVEFSCPTGGRLVAGYAPSPTTQLLCPFVPGNYRVRGYPPYVLQYAPEVTDLAFVSDVSVISNSFAVVEVWSPPVASLPAPGDWVISSPIVTQPVGTYCVVIPPPGVIDFARSIPGLGEWIDFDSITYIELCLRVVRFYYAGPLYERAVVLMNALTLLVIASLVFLVVRSLRS